MSYDPVRGGKGQISSSARTFSRQILSLASNQILLRTLGMRQSSDRMCEGRFFIFPKLLSLTGVQNKLWFGNFYFRRDIN